MANKNYIGHEYYCQVCKSFFTATEESIDNIYLEHDNGEEIGITTIECFNCKSMSLPEGMNQIAWLKEEMNIRNE